MNLKAIDDSSCDLEGCRAHWGSKHPAGTSMQFPRRAVKFCVDHDTQYLAEEGRLRGRTQSGPRNTHPTKAVR